MTRRYLRLLPLSILYTSVICIPLLRLRCECTNYRQCDILSGFVDKRVANTFVNPAYKFKQPPGWSDFDAQTVVDSGGSGTAGDNDASSEGGLSEDETMGHDDNGVGALDYDPEEKGFKSRKNKYNVDVDKLLKESCTCAGVIYKPDSPGLPWKKNARESCMWWPPPKNKGRFFNSKTTSQNWCFIRNASADICKRKSILVRTHMDEASNHYVSKDLCNNECKCSGIGMNPKKNLKLVDKSIRYIGGGEDVSAAHPCQKWLKTNSRPWCFVGFDSPCSDRQLYTLASSEVVDPPDSIERLSQFYSFIPCNQAIKDWAEFLCRGLRDSVLGLLAMLNLLTVMVIPALCLFVNNRCGDRMEVNEDFEVYFSSDDDDFDLGEEGSPSSPAKPSARGSSRKSVARKSLQVRKSLAHRSEDNPQREIRFDSFEESSPAIELAQLPVSKEASRESAAPNFPVAEVDAPNFPVALDDE